MTRTAISPRLAMRTFWSTLNTVTPRMVLAMSGGPELTVRRFEELVSTNAYLLEEGRLGAPAGTVAVANYQTAGRGRLGRRWEAPPGTCLLLSVLLRPSFEPSAWHLCAGALGLAAIEACAQVSDVVPQLKWPNDLLVEDRKLAGILAESEPGRTACGPAVALVAGIGLNVTWGGPPGLQTTSLSAEAGRPIAVRDVEIALLERFGVWADRLESPEGRLEVAAGLRERCATIGREVRVVLVSGELTGTAVDLTSEGHLVVATATGRRVVLAGDVHHLRPK